MLESLWHKTIQKREYPSLNHNVNTNLLIIGGGITAILNAYLLRNHYHDITIVTNNRFFSGTTGFTTAKVTYQHGYFYHDLVKGVGVKKASDYFNLNKDGIELIKKIVETEKIECDFVKVSNYLVSDKNHIAKEKEAYDKLNISYESTTYKKEPALKVSNQYVFNPLLFLNELLKILDKKINIFENTKITKIKNLTSYTEDGFEITAENIIVATNYPLYPCNNLFFTKLAPNKSYVVVTNKKDESDCVYYYKDEAVTYRTYREFLLVSGLAHEMNNFVDTNKVFRNLKTYADDKIHYAWSNRDFKSVDLIPFIGRISDNIYISTGYGEWGMSNSAGGAKLIYDLITENNTDYADTFNPKRLIFNSKRFTYNLKKFKKYICNNKPLDNEEIDEDKKVIITFDKKRYGVYKDEKNDIHIIKTKCTHLGCYLQFNKVNKVYECFCHGSMFDIDGKLINGPAIKDLKHIVLENEETENDDHKKVDHKKDDHKKVDYKMDVPKINEPKINEPIKDEPKIDEPKNDDSKKDDSKKNNSKRDESKKE